MQIRPPPLPCHYRFQVSILLLLSRRLGAWAGLLVVV